MGCTPFHFMPQDTKYRWNYSFSWVVEYVRKDAEISIELDGVRVQKVITKGCVTREETERIARDYCTKLDTVVQNAIKQQISSLKDAKE